MANEVQEIENIEGVVKPCKVRLLPGYVFRQNNPAVVGVEVIVGTLKNGIPLMKEGKWNLTSVKGIQDKGENISDAQRGMQVAISLPGVTVGRQIFEGDVLYSDISEDDFKGLKKVKKYLGKDEIELLKEISQMKRKDNPVWGV